MPLHAANVAAGRVTVDGASACVQEAGQGPLLVLVASMLVLARSYGPTVQHLARHFRVLTVELPGSGHADRLDQPWRMDDYARWLAAFIERMSEPLTLIGHSDSGAVVLATSVKRPAHLARIVVADSVGVQRQPLARILGGRAIDACLEPALTCRGIHHPAYNLVRHTANFLRQVRASSTADLSQQCADIGVPALIAWGSRDHTMPPALAAKLRHLLRTSEVSLCATGSHDWLITHPAAFAAAVHHFALAPRVLPAPL